MAKVIKGISVEIGGNASPLKKALNDVDKTSRNLQSELRTIDKLLKLDPTNVDLLKQKQDVLSESIENTEEKLRRLKSAEDKVAQAFEDGKIDAEQYRAFQRNIVTTEQKLNDLKSELDKTGQAFEDLGTDAKKSEKKLDDYKKEVDDVKNAVSDLKDKAKDTALELGAGITAAGGAAAAAMMSFNSVDSALNHIQASTNLSKGQMDGFRNALEEIYNGNYGDDLSDIASKMANIVQYTNETDPEKIKDYAIKLYGLQDTFDLDFNETLRGTQGLIKNMGLTADQAFDFIASGAQNGLNYSGELSDNLSEYTSLFGQAGFTAEQMFSILDNGTESGAYNLDKVNDFVKEFTISLADGRIEENLSSFSGGTSDLFKKWKDGKATAADVFYSVINDLSTAENKQTALTTASNVWSSLGEDNALNIITSLDDVNKKFSDVKGTMDEVNDIEYDDLGNRIEGLGRKVQTEIINPAVEEFYPEAEDFIDWVADNLDTLIPILEGVARQLGIIWATKKVNDFRKSITNVISTYKTLKTATDGATTAQKALNIAQNSNAIGLVISLVGTLVNVFMTLNDTLGDDVKKTRLLTEEQEKLYESIDKNKQSWDELTQARSESSADITNEYGYYDSLLDELEQITDENGKIKSGYEERADTIINTLSGALDIEIEKNGNVITNYQDICNEIQKTIDLERARAQQQVYADSYEEAIKNQTQAWNDLKDAQDNEVDIADQIAKVQAELDENTKEYNKTVQTSTGLQRVHTSQYDPVVQKQQQLQSSLNILKLEQTKANQKTKDAQDVYLGYVNTIKNYEGVTSAIAEGDTKKINDALNRMVNNFITAENGTKESLEQQVADMKDNYNSLKTAVDEGAPGVTQTMVDNAKSMVDSAVEELDKFKEQTPKSAKGGVDAFTGELTSDETNEKCKDAGKNIRDKTNEGIDGEDGAYQIGFGKGKDYGNGFCGGIADSFFDAYSAGDSLAAFAMKGTQDKQKSSSPSKEARKLGNDNGDGYVLGVIDKKDDATEAGEALAENALSAMRARQKIINSFSQTNNDQNNMILPSVSTRIMAQTAAKSNNAPEVKQINLGGLTLKIEHFENRSAADVNKVTDQFMHAVENYVSRRDAFK